MGGQSHALVQEHHAPLEVQAIDEMPHRKPVYDSHSEQRVQISCVDVRRAYFNAKIPEDQPIYVELPPEDGDWGKGMCARLRVHMYGTRPAADGWHSEFSSALDEMGMMRGESSACVFVHKEKQILCLSLA